MRRNAEWQYSKKNTPTTENLSNFQKTWWCSPLPVSLQQTLITSRNKHVVHFMKVGHKCNKADKVIRSATGHFIAAHTPHIGLGREIWWSKEGEFARLQRTRGGLMACDWIHSYTLIPAAMTICRNFPGPVEILWQGVIYMSIHVTQICTVHSSCRPLNNLYSWQKSSFVSVFFILAI